MISLWMKTDFLLRNKSNKMDEQVLSEMVCLAKSKLMKDAIAKLKKRYPCLDDELAHQEAERILGFSSEKAQLRLTEELDQFDELPNRFYSLAPCPRQKGPFPEPEFYFLWFGTYEKVEVQTDF